MRALVLCSEDGTVRVVSLAGGAGSLMYTKRISVATSRLLSLAIQEHHGSPLVQGSGGSQCGFRV